MLRCCALSLLLATAATGPAAAQAPPGFKTYENKLASLAFFYPTAFQEVPLPPTEQVLQARFVLGDKPDELKKLADQLYKAAEPQLLVYRFEIPTAVTGAAAPAEEGEKAGPASVREAMEAKSRVSSWAEFEKRFANWQLAEEPKKPGHFTLTLRAKWPDADHRPIGRLVKKQVGNIVFGAYGFHFQPLEKQFATQFGKFAASIELAEEDAGEFAEAKIDQLYASGKFRAVELRKQARRALAKGWKAFDTENYLIVHHSKNEALIKRIGRDIEAMRLLYIEQFPPRGPIDKLSIVRVCRTKEEYHQYGGPPNTGGYWHPGNEELVFYDYSYTMKTLDADEKKALGGRKLDDDDSLLVLYHEAFHQYIHYAVGEFAPHDWFNEGYGDYFSGAVVADNTPKVLRVDPSPWRIHLAKDMCEYGDGFVPLKEILEAERAVFYNPARIRFFYAGAWSFVYFLKHSKEVAAHPRWSKLLQTYFDTAKRVHEEEVGKLGESPDLAKKQVAAFAARKAALKAALDGIDVAELETVWRKWVVAMKDPWPSQRKKRK